MEELKVELVSDSYSNTYIQDGEEYTSNHNRVYKVTNDVEAELFKTVERFGVVAANFHDFPEELRYLIGGQGDEDYCVLAKKDSYVGERIVEGITVCDNVQVTVLYGDKEYTLSVTFHS